MFNFMDMVILSGLNFCNIYGFVTYHNHKDIKILQLLKIFIN